MLAGQAHVVVRTVNVDVLFPVLGKSGHEGFEIFLAANFAHELGGEVAMHARTVPVGVAERLAMEFDVDAVLFAKTQQQVTGDPDLVGGALGALAEYLEFPLALGHFGIDAFVVDAGFEAEIEVLFNDFAGNRTDILEADAGVIRTLRSRVTLFREAERAAVLVEEVFLLETEPCIFVVEDGCAAVRRMRGDAIGHHDFAHDECTIGAGRVGIDRDGLQHAIRRVAFGLLRGRAIKAPKRQLLECGEFVEFLDLGLAAQVGDRLVSVQPDVLEFELSHYEPLIGNNAKP